MRPVSTEFLAAISASHQIATRATVLPAEVEIPFTDGSVTLDGFAATRASLNLTVASTDLVPTLSTDYLAPYSNEIQIERGVTYPDGRTEFVSLGIFGIRETDVEDTGDDMPISLTCLDRSARIIDAKFTTPYAIFKGTNIRQAILATIQAEWAAVPYIFAATSVTSPTVLALEEADRWDFCQGLAEAAGMRLYFDGDGILQLQTIPRTATSIWDVAEGTGGVLLRASRNWSRTDSFNLIIVTGENTSGEPVRGGAADINPLSPTYYNGSFGHVPRWYQTPFIGGQAVIDNQPQAYAVAANILAQELGTTQGVSFGSLVNPALEPHDVVGVKRARLGIDEAHTIDELTIPLSHDGTLTASTRSVVAADGVGTGGIVIFPGPVAPPPPPPAAPGVLYPATDLYPSATLYPSGPVAPPAPPPPPPGQPPLPPATKYGSASFTAAAQIYSIAEGTAEPGPGGISNALGTFTTAAVEDNETAVGTILLAQGTLRITRISANHKCRIRIYDTIAHRDADLSRDPWVLPTGTHGVILDYGLSMGNENFVVIPATFSPGIEGPAASPNVPIAVTNQRGSTLTITVEVTSG